MKRMRFAFFVLFLIDSGAAHALGAFSRACNFNDVPKWLQRPAAHLFYSLGAPEELKDMHQNADRGSYWIVEAITADYGLLRYYLYAEAFVYERVYVYGQATKNSTMTKSYSSGYFKAQKLDDSIVNFQLFKDIFFSNRKFMFSVRAGEPAIYSRPLNPIDRVYGRHAYLEPKSQRVRRLQDTVAFDCNLGQWGFGVR